MIEPFDPPRPTSLTYIPFKDASRSIHYKEAALKQQAYKKEKLHKARLKALQEAKTPSKEERPITSYTIRRRILYVTFKNNPPCYYANASACAFFLRNGISTIFKYLSGVVKKPEYILNLQWVSKTVLTEEKLQVLREEGKLEETSCTTN